jgi:hypothetical protein
MDCKVNCFCDNGHGDYLVMLSAYCALDFYAIRKFDFVVYGFHTKHFVFCFFWSVTNLWLRNRDTGASKSSKSPGDRTWPEPHQPLTRLAVFRTGDFNIAECLNNTLCHRLSYTSGTSY